MLNLIYHKAMQQNDYILCISMAMSVFVIYV